MAREPEKLPSEREALQAQITKDREDFIANGDFSIFAWCGDI